MWLKMCNWLMTLLSYGISIKINIQGRNEKEGWEGRKTKKERDRMKRSKEEERMGENVMKKEGKEEVRKQMRRKRRRWRRQRKKRSHTVKAWHNRDLLMLLKMCRHTILFLHCSGIMEREGSFFVCFSLVPLHLISPSPNLLYNSWFMEKKAC